MSCGKTLNAGTGCSDRCRECGDAGAEKGSELSALIPEKSRFAASDLMRAARQSLGFKRK